jgi:hypothetical protein
MKRVVIFFLFLCFLLVSRLFSVQANAHNYSIEFASVQAKKSQRVESIPGHKSFTVDTNTGISNEGDYIITDDDVDDEYITKSLQQAKFFLAFSIAFILSFSRSSIANRLPFCRHLSYISSDIYIVQRALRI